MNSEMVQVVVWVMVDEAGEVQVSEDRDELTGPDGLATRVLCVTLNVPKPAPLNLITTVDAETEGATLRVM